MCVRVRMQVVGTDVARGVFDTPGEDDPWNYQQVQFSARLPLAQCLPRNI